MAKEALLIMDYQTGLVDALGTPRLLSAATRAIGAARRAGQPVIFVRVAFRPGYPEVSPANRGFSAIAAGPADYREASPTTAIHPHLGPEASDVVVTKRRISAFSGSDLDMILRAMGVQSIVLAGLTTSGVVLSTVREAADRDYQISVLADACTDPDPAVHAVLMETLFPRQATVLSAEEWSTQQALGMSAS